MADFSAGDLSLQYNKGTDAAPDWTGTSISFSGSGGANELRFCATGQGTGVTSSATWPFVTRPTSGAQPVGELWCFSTDTNGIKVSGYDGTNGKSNVLRWQWGSSGTMSSSPQFTLFANSNRIAPTPGVQPPGTNNDVISNGSTMDTASSSYLKAAAYGAYGLGNLPAGAIGTTPTATTGIAGVTIPSVNAWSPWTSLQGFIQYLQHPSVPLATTASAWNWSMILFMGIGMTTGILQPVLTFQYTYS